MPIRWRGATALLVIGLEAGLEVDRQAAGAS
jgi:hypothetical protein